MFAWVEGDCRLEINKEMERRGTTTDRRHDTNQSGCKKTDTEHRSIRVSTDKIDNMLNLVGELVITQSILNRVCSELGSGSTEKLQECLEQLERNTRDLQ